MGDAEEEGIRRRNLETDDWTGQGFRNNYDPAQSFYGQGDHYIKYCVGICLQVLNHIVSPRVIAELSAVVLLSTNAT